MRWLIGTLVRFRPDVLRYSSDMFFVGSELLAYNEAALSAALHGVRWHDEPGNCPTWAAGCSCDVEAT